MRRTQKDFEQQIYRGPTQRDPTRPSVGSGSGSDADLLDGQHGSWYRDRANHTGTQLASTISDFSTAVRTSLDKIVTAGEALGGNRAVYVAADGKAYYANPDATSRLTSGLTTGAASLGASVTIQPDGEMDEPSWTWADTGPVWLAASGQLTQTLPTTGYLFQVGVPMGPTRLRIEPQLVAQLP